MEKKNKVIAKIQNVEYTLVGDVDQKQVDKINTVVNEMIEDVRKSNPFMNKNMTFILCSINLSDEILKLQDKYSVLEKKIDQIEDINDLKEQLSTYKEHNKQNNETLNELKQQKEKYKREVQKSNELIEKYTKKIKQYKFDLEESRKTILDLQNQLFESQIELVKSNKSSVENIE